MKLACLIVLYNFSDENYKNIVSYLNLFEKVYILDNSLSSSDKYNCFENTFYFCFNKNMGLGYALNFGAKLAKKDGFDYLITMDQDSILEKDGFNEYCNSILKLKKAALVCPQYLIERKRKVKKENKIKKIKLTMQSASIINLDVLEKLGYFKENYFIDCIDYDFCLKAISNGYFIYQNMNYIVKHNPGITKKTKLLKIKYGYCSPIRIYYQIRNLNDLFRNYRYFKIKFIIFYKIIKIILFFDNKKAFINMYKEAKCDFKNLKLGEKEF